MLAVIEEDLGSIFKVYLVAKNSFNQQNPQTAKGRIHTKASIPVTASLNYKT